MTSKILRIYTEATSESGGIWAFKPFAFRHVCWIPEQDYHAALDRAEIAEGSLQKAQRTFASGWRFLDEWVPADGTWAILWPGYYGPFTACRINGEWSMCDNQDLNNATIAMPCPEPRHDMTDHFVIQEWNET